MPRQKRLRGSETFNLNLTPLLDVVLQLITFFMMLIHFGTKLEGATKEIRLPIAPAALPGSDLSLDRMVVVIDRDGRLVIDGERLDGRKADAWWAAQAKERIAGQETLGGPAEELSTLVIVRADKAASYGSIRRTLATAQERGFAHFSLVVLRRRPTMSRSMGRSTSRRPGTPEEVAFPVTPMLDMAFQLLAFFVLTFQAPSAETHVDLDLPASPLALPSESAGKAQPSSSRRVDLDLENDLWVRAESNDLGDLKALRLGDSTIADLPALGERLQRYVEVLEGQPLRVRLVADDELRYEEAARVISTISAAGVAAIRLTDPSGQSAAPVAAPEPAR